MTSHEIIDIEKVRQKSSFVIWICILISVFVCALFAGFYIAQFGYLQTGGTTIPTGAEVPVTPTTESAKAVTDDLMKALVPFLAFVLAFLVGVFGLRRLESFDAELRLMRSELNDRVQQQQEFFAGTIETLAEKYVGDQYGKQLERVERDIARLLDEKNQVVATIDASIKPFEWLKEHSANVRQTLKKPSSVGAARKAISELFSEGNSEQAVAMARIVATDGDLEGTPIDYFNISADLGRNDQEALALEICKRGIDKYSDDIDLLSHALDFSTKIGQRAEATAYYEALQSIDRSRWNWRAYVFTGDYLFATGRINEAIKNNEDFADHIPTDERAFSQSASIYEKTGQVDKVIEICRKGLAAIPRVTQLGLLYAQALLEKGDYRACVDATTTGLSGSATGQPSANQATLLWIRANAYDAMAVDHLRQMTNEQRVIEDEKDVVLNLAKRAVICYRSAWSLPIAHAHYLQQGTIRLSALKSLLQEAGASESALSKLFDDDLSESQKGELLAALAKKLTNNGIVPDSD